jgi:1-deoxy-D-xylulose 5-phosphate reductoisomerase
VSLQQTTGAGSAGAYVLYINATGTNVEGLKVDAGAVVFDETLTVTGASTLTGNVTMSGTAAVTGQFNANAAVVFAGTETIVAGGTSTALNLTKSLHYIDADAGGDTFTLADGTNGQVTTILLTSSTGIATITPANLAGGTSVTLNADGDSVVLQFMDTEWFILGGNSYAVV